MDKLLEAKDNRDDEDKAAILKRLEEHQQQITLITYISSLFIHCTP